MTKLMSHFPINTQHKNSISNYPTPNNYSLSFQEILFKYALNFINTFFSIEKKYILTS